MNIMLPVSYSASYSLLALCLIPSMFSDSPQVLINSDYPQKGNYNYIELLCVDTTSKTTVAGAKFQFNGSDIEKHNGNDEVLFVSLSQENEGFFTCSLNGSISANKLGFAGSIPKPITSVIK